MRLPKSYSREGMASSGLNSFNWGGGRRDVCQRGLTTGCQNSSRGKRSLGWEDAKMKH